MTVQVKPLFYFQMVLRRFLQGFFHLLYHPFAFTYDLVAAIVSLGQWKNWVHSILPYITGREILELGHGPGHLQNFLFKNGRVPFGLDESRQMGTLAHKQLGAAGRLTRGHAQSLPFKRQSFDSIVSTFPTEYIFDSRTLVEAQRVLRDDGTLVILPLVWPKGSFLKWLYRVTGETPSDLNERLIMQVTSPLKEAGFITEARVFEVKSGSLLIIEARKR